MGQGISLKNKMLNHGLNHELFILLHTQSIVCATVYVRSMFRVLGIHNFVFNVKIDSQYGYASNLA